MTDQSIAWMREQKSLKPDKPFFIYYSSAGSHAPHHPPKKYIDKYKGKFDKGWDVIRQREIYQKQLAMGVIPKDTKLADKVSTLPVWDDMTAQQKRVFARQLKLLPHLLSIPITKQVDLSMQLTIWANLTTL